MPSKDKKTSPLKSAAVILGIAVVLVFTLEGLASFIFLTMELKKIRIPAERLHTEYDPLLGWINKRNVNIPDMYGPGIYLRTNAQRYRHDGEVGHAPPAGTSRWICCGDSFTFGYGVDNEDTWCAHLTRMVPGIQTVNMGQGGYGLDQMYLWYMRDGFPLEHDVLIVAFITTDIPRMARDTFMKYPKPILSVENGRIVNHNDPVPKPGLITVYFPRLVAVTARLSVIQLFHRLSNQFKRHAADPSLQRSQQQLLELTLAIFEHLNDAGRKLNRRVFFVHLPVEKDFKKSPEDDRFRAFLHNHARKADWHYIDLITELRKLDAAEVSGLFIQRDIPDYTDARGHYSESGNKYIADILVREIMPHRQK